MKEKLTALRSLDGFHSQRILPMLAVETLGTCLAPRIDVLGKENLMAVRDLDRESDIHFFFLASHPNDADTTILFKAIKRSGAESLTKKIVPLKGKQLENNDATKWLSRSYDTILALPPWMEDKEHVKMNLNTYHAMKNAIKLGMHILIYPETRVSPDGTLQSGFPEVSRLISQRAIDNTFLVYVGISGTKDMFSTEFPFFRFGKPTVNIGEPENFAKIKNEFGEDYEGMVNHFMRRIANLLPQENRGVYA